MGRPRGRLSSAGVPGSQHRRYRTDGARICREGARAIAQCGCRVIKGKPRTRRAINARADIVYLLFQVFEQPRSMYDTDDLCHASHTAKVNHIVSLADAASL